MELHDLAVRLSSVLESGESVLTLTLDLAKSGAPPPATRIFLKDHVWKLKGIDKARRFVENKLKPGTDGLFLVSGPSVWEAVELKIPFRNFVHVGRSPFVAPLLEGLARSPRACVAEVHSKGGTIHEVALGVWTERDRVEIRGPEEKLEVRRGGGKHGRYDQAAEKATDAMLREAARKAATLNAPVIFLTGDRECANSFREHLPPAMRDRVRPVASKEGVAGDLEKSSREASEKRLLEFHERREQGHLVAVGPRDVFEHANEGRVVDIIIDPCEPVPGFKCLSCGTRTSEAGDHCGLCGGATAGVSLTQEAVAHALAHPPIGLTFAPGPAKWLAQAGGIVALLSEKGVRTKRK